MELLDSITVTSPRGEHYIQLFHGDLANMPANHNVDVLIVSAFPNDYSPTPSSLIGALKRQGVSVYDLSYDKAADLREAFSCWMSKPINQKIPGIEFKRILCFEPLVRGKPSQVVGDIFQSLLPFVYADPYISSIAMPLVATGDQRVPLKEMIEPLLDAAVNWLKLGLPVTNIKIVQHSESRALELKGAFSILKKKYEIQPPSQASRSFTYDLFISYSHQNREEANIIWDEFNHQMPSSKIFIDRKELNTGAAWQQQLYEALDDCRKVLTIYSPDYLNSKVCKEEYNIALLRHREADGGVLMPLYLYSAKLPTYMQLIQFIDCREGNKEKLKAACKTIMELL